MLKVIEVECPYTPRGVLENESEKLAGGKIAHY